MTDQDFTSQLNSPTFQLITENFLRLVKLMFVFLIFLLQTKTCKMHIEQNSQVASRLTHDLMDGHPVELLQENRKSRSSQEELILPILSINLTWTR